MSRTETDKRLLSRKPQQKKQWLTAIYVLKLTVRYLRPIRCIYFD